MWGLCFNGEVTDTVHHQKRRQSLYGSKNRDKMAHDYNSKNRKKAAKMASYVITKCPLDTLLNPREALIVEV